MIPYYLLTRDLHHYDQVARDLNQYSRVNTHLHERPTANQSGLSISEMVSSGTLHAVNAVQKGWNNVSSLFKG